MKRKRVFKIIKFSNKCKTENIDSENKCRNKILLIFFKLVVIIGIYYMVSMSVQFWTLVTQFVLKHFVFNLHQMTTRMEMGGPGGKKAPGTAPKPGQRGYDEYAGNPADLMNQSYQQQRGMYGKQANSYQTEIFS